MNWIHMQMLCQSCPGKKRVQHAANDAKRISRRLQELLRNPVSSRRRGNSTSRLFHNSARCTMTGNSCSKLSMYESELRQAEHELDSVFSALLDHLKAANDEKAASTLRQAAFELLRGHYPEAARILQS